MLKFKASEFFQGDLSEHELVSNGCLVHQQLQPGVDLYCWSGSFDQPIAANAVDDSGRIHFSYWLKGCATDCLVEGTGRKRGVVHAEGTGNIGYGPQRRAQFKQHGEFSNLNLLIDPACLSGLMQGEESGLARIISDGVFHQNDYRSAELQTVAYHLSQALHHGGRHPLWVQAKVLEMISLFFESHDEPVSQRMSAAENRRLLQARDRLLSDLAKAPTIAELANETGLNVLKLKQGFKELFGVGVYGLYQQERMHQAYRLLQADGASVGGVAVELGYTNSSHFASAFRKQFGVSPGEIKRLAI